MPKEVRGGGSHCEWESWLPRGARWDCQGLELRPGPVNWNTVETALLWLSGPLLRATLIWAAEYETDDGLGLLGV